MVQIESAAPLSAIRRLAAMRSGAVAVRGGGVLGHQYAVAAPRGIAALPVLSQLAQSGLVTAIQIDCPPQVYPN